MVLLVLVLEVSVVVERRRGGIFLYCRHTKAKCLGQCLDLAKKWGKVHLSVGHSANLSKLHRDR